MEFVSILINRVADIIWFPLSFIPDYLGIILISLLSAGLFLIIFKKTSNQDQIRQNKNKIFAYLFQIRLYKNQPLLTIKSTLNIVWYNIKYLQYTLVPLVVLVIPLLLISIQMNNRYGYEPLKPLSSFNIRVNLDKEKLTNQEDLINSLTCLSSKGIIIETPPLRLVSEASIFWRAKIVENNQIINQYCQVVNQGNNTNIIKKVVTSKRVRTPFTPDKKKYTLKSIFSASAEEYIPRNSAIEKVRISYKRATYPFLFWQLDVIILYFILLLIFSFALKGFFKVAI